MTGKYMMIDEGTYTCRPGRVRDFQEIYEQRAKPIQWPIVGEPIGFFTIDTGTLSQVVHMWKYENMAERYTPPHTHSSAPGPSASAEAAQPLLSAPLTHISRPNSLAPRQIRNTQPPKLTP